MIFSSVIGYIVGLVAEKYRGTNKLKIALIVSIVLNLLISDFFISNIDALFGSKIPLLHIYLPLGISFFIFQTISYTVDIYRGSVPSQRNLANFTMYISMFPQLVAGPIIRYHTVAAEIEARTHSLIIFLME